MTKANELREMSDEQVKAVWKDAAESLFKLRLQAQTEKLASPSEVRKSRKTIARCQTVLAERSKVAAASASGESGEAGAGAV